jgi:hypothetical protein
MLRRGASLPEIGQILDHRNPETVLVKYLQRRKRFLEGRASPYVFTSGTGNRLDKADAHRTFYVLSRQIGLRGPTASRGPRLTTSVRMPSPGKCRAMPLRLDLASFANRALGIISGALQLV